MDIALLDDASLLREIARRFEEKAASIREMEFMTKKLLELNEKSKEAEEVKSYFLSLIKNEFNNPMSVLLSLVRRVGNETDPERSAMIVSMMQRELTYLDFSLKNIFAASEIEYGQNASRYSLLRPEEIAREAIDYFGWMIAEKGLKVEVFSALETMLSDPAKLYLILLNLLSNACEFSYPSTMVAVLFIERDDEYEIRVENSGEGVHESHSKHIYNRFYKYSTGKTRPTQGMGLGLSVVKELCESMGGGIDHYEEENRTVFVATLPRVRHPQASIAVGLGSDEFFEGEFAEGPMEF